MIYTTLWHSTQLVPPQVHHQHTCTLYIPCTSPLRVFFCTLGSWTESFKWLTEELILASHSHILLSSHVQISSEMRQGLLVAMSTHVVARNTVTSLFFNVALQFHTVCLTMLRKVQKPLRCLLYSARFVHVIHETLGLFAGLFMSTQ